MVRQPDIGQAPAHPDMHRLLHSAVRAVETGVWAIRVRM
jgi:hypothetical protein